MLKETIALISVFMLMLSACTGGKNAPVEGPGSFKIAPGETIEIDVQDIVALNAHDYTLSLRSVSADFSTSKVLLDFTSLVASQLTANSKVHFIVPKNVVLNRPILVVADIPALNTQMVDVLYDEDGISRPGIASTLTYTLMKYYPSKDLQAYSSSDFHGIQNLIQARTDQLISESEHLNLASISFPKLMRYFKNGVAFNINFLSEIRRYGIDYSFDTTMPAGLEISDTPEQSLVPYQYATHFKINGATVDIAPFNHTNSPPMLTPGVSAPNPGAGLYISEGNPISVGAQGFDLDDDFIDKNMIIQYIPRVLPSSLTSASGFPVIPEPTPQYTTLTNQTDPLGIDLYDSAPIAFNEALDPIVYPNSLPIDSNLYPLPGAVPDTAYRNIYYSISDGMIRVPYRWNFKYADVNRQPKIVRNSSNKMNDTYFDNIIAPGEVEVLPGTGWKIHGSHCESDPAFSYQTITKRSDGPWSCAFRMIDPDIDDDPNAAADNFYYTLVASDNSSIIKANSQKIWPQYVAPFTAPRVLGTTLTNCVTPDGKTHYRCGVGLYQVTIDNSVKAAAESKTSQIYNYDVVIYDRPLSIGGNSTSASLGRTIQILAQPARLVNYSDPAAPNGLQSLNLIDTSTNTYFRKDTYLNEILDAADPLHSITDLSDIGMGSGGLSSILAGASNRSAFMEGTAYEITPYAVQPHTIAGGTLVLDPATYNALSGSPGSLNLFGHSMTTADVSTYSDPWEFDSTCKLKSNNLGSDWDQDAQQGWTFEINAIDYDNVGLAVGEASDPVHIQFSTDINTAINAAGIQYCNYLNPNTDPAYYQTYRATASAPAVNQETCAWSALPPADMQAIPVYYTIDDGGQPAVKKWVYHRLRFKWQPKDQGLTNGKTLDPPFFIKNMISAGMKLSGNRYLVKNDNLDLNKMPSSMSLYANRKEMQPCLVGLTGKAGVIHQLNTAPAGAIRFEVSDENKVLSKFPTGPGALMGRFEAEFKVMGTRSITDPSFIQFVPYLVNCTTRDVDLSSTPTSPPATNSNGEAAIWYSVASDGNIPRLRFQTATDPGANSMCFNYNLSPAKTFGGVQYNEVLLIENLSGTAMTLNDSFFNVCTSRATLSINAEQKYIVLASTCGVGHTKGQSLSSANPNYSVTVAYVGDPTLSENGALPVGTSPLKLDLLPSFYQAGLATNFPADFNFINALFFDVSVFDTFRLDPGTGVPTFTSYFTAGQPTWLTNDATNAIPPNPPFAAPGYAYGLQVIDWDNQATNLALASPAPDPNLPGSNVYFRIAPGDSARIQLFVKNRAPASFRLKVTDVLDTNPLELDPYDVMSFTLQPPGTLPSGPASFAGIGRANCIDPPAAYPSLSALNVNTLKDFKKCDFSWAPAITDDGLKFAYTFSVQDNNGANATVMGIGGKHPASTGGPGYSANIPNDSLAKSNGPMTTFSLDIESLEVNSSPFFTASLNGAAVTSPYNSAGGAPGWTSVFANNTPLGAQSTCSSPAPGFSCALSVNQNDTLQSNSPIALTEGTQKTFTVFAKDSNVTPALKTLTAAPPTSVLIVDGPFQGKTFNVPSFASMSILATQNVANGTASFIFNWTPTDSEANWLSNSGGFLIPMVIKDQNYVPASDSGFPVQFTVPSAQSKIWIWAKLNVSNSKPQVFYLNGTSEAPLDGATLTFQTGAPSSYTIRVKDSDVARYKQSGERTGFSPTFTFSPSPTPNFTNISSIGAAVLSADGFFVQQDFILNGNPSNSDINTYTTPQIGATDPGDPSFGMASNSDLGSPYPRARVSASGIGNGNGLVVPFNIVVVGKPQFLAPGPTPATSSAFAYATLPFTYPLAMSISRQNELKQDFFIGFNQATTITPVKKTAAGSGIYVSYAGPTLINNYIVKWPDSNALNIIAAPGQDRTLAIYGVKNAFCNVADGGTYPAITLIRYNETTATLDTCKLTSLHLSGDAANTNLTITLVDKTQSTNPVPSLTLTEMDRNYTQSPAPTNLNLALNRQFADFIGRCSNCNVLPTPCNASASNFALTVGSTATQVCPEPNTGTLRTGYLEYNYGSYISRFIFDTASSFAVKKVYQDINPTSVRTTTAMVTKGETLHFVANTTVPAVSNLYQYRWYVNGCLKASGLINNAPITYDLKVNSQTGGLNNDCTGEFGFNESNATSLGKLVVRLSLVRGNEILTAASEASVNSYLWNLSVLNTDPNVITTATYAPASPVTLAAATGNRNVQFATSVSYASKNYLAYTDLNASTGLKVRLTELDVLGNVATAGSNLALNCDVSFTSQPQWLGMQPSAGGNLYISASTNTTYPTSGANITYGAKNQTCFTSSLSLGTPTASTVNYNAAGSVTPAGYLGLSKYALSTRSLATFTTLAPIPANLYKDGINEAEYFLIDGNIGTSTYWTYPLVSLYTVTPTQFQTPYANNSVRRNIVSGNNLFQLVGSYAPNSSGWRGFILPSTLAKSFPKLVASMGTPIMFADPSALPAPAANDCQFNGTPLDAVYVPSIAGVNVDTLYVLAAGDTVGKIVAIRNVTGAAGTPTCVEIADVKNPSLLQTDHNPNLSKMVFDSNRGVIYGIIIPGNGVGGQFYSLDILSEQLAARDLSATLSPYELLYSAPINALYLFDNRKSAAPLLSPTLYKIW